MDNIIKLIAINSVLLIIFFSLPNIETQEIAEIQEETIVIETIPKENEKNNTEISSRSEESHRTIKKNLTLTTTSNLTELSNCSEDDFNKMLKDTALNGLGSTLVQIEQQYGINGLYVMGLACEESAYGSSNIAKTKNNITGYCVYDTNTKAGKKFSSYSECLLVTSKLLKEKYLTEGACYYNGYTPKSIDVKYCTDKTHADKIVNIVNKLIKKI